MLTGHNRNKRLSLFEFWAVLSIKALFKRSSGDLNKQIMVLSLQTVFSEQFFQYLTCQKQDLTKQKLSLASQCVPQQFEYYF